MFDAKKETKNIIEFIQDYYKSNDLGGVIIGISGGKDSAVVAALFTHALGKENVLGVTIPCHSKKEDKTHAKIISDYYGFELINFDLTATYETFQQELSNIDNFNISDKKNSDINLKPRLRMSTLYYLAALYSSIKRKTYLVAGTSNKCELFVGYFTKGGDSVHDISVLANFTVDEVIQIGEFLNVPKEILYKTPSDGLSNQTDEDKLGVTYKDIALYIQDPSQLTPQTAKKITNLHQKSTHKFKIPTYE